MLDEPTPADPIDLAAQAADDAQFFRAVLHEAINAGVDHIRIGVEHAKSRAADGEANPTADAAAYDSVTRSIRRSIMLAQRVTDPAAAARTAQHRTGARKRVLREVEDVIQREVSDKREQEALHAELLERLDRPDFLEDLETHSIAEMTTNLVRDLGLASRRSGPSPWTRRTPADIDLLNARAAGTQPAPQSDPERTFRIFADPIDA